MRNHQAIESDVALVRAYAKRHAKLAQLKSVDEELVRKLLASASRKLARAILSTHHQRTILRLFDYWYQRFPKLLLDDAAQIPRIRSAEFAALTERVTARSQPLASAHRTAIRALGVGPDSLFKAIRRKEDAASKLLDEPLDS
jgi:hypothetical protein